MRELARAAVSGDENALEAFEYKKAAMMGGQKKEPVKGMSFYGSSEALCFILCGSGGSVFYVNEIGRLHKLYQMDGAVVKLLFNQEKSLLISITEHLMVGQCILKSELEVNNLVTVKLNGGTEPAEFTWLSNNLLAYVSGESVVRYFQTLFMTN